MIGKTCRVSAAALLISCLSGMPEAGASGVTSQQVIASAADIDKTVTPPIPSAVSAVAWIDADTFATGGHDNTVRIWRRLGTGSTSTFVPGEVFRAHKGVVQGVAPRPGTSPPQVASGSQDGTVSACQVRPRPPHRVRR